MSTEKRIVYKLNKMISSDFPLDYTDRYNIEKCRWTQRPKLCDDHNNNDEDNSPIIKNANIY